MNNTLGGFLSALATAFTKTPTLDKLPADILSFRVKQDAERTRASDHLYITDFVDPCLRRLAFLMIRPDFKDKPKEPKSLFDMDAGTAIHEWFQNNVLGPMGTLKGTWKCSVCGGEVKGAMPTAPCTREIKIMPSILDTKWVETTCKSVGAIWKFKEEHIDLEFNGIKVTGRPDGRLALGEEYVLEIKSKDPDLFEKVEQPDAPHIFQGSVYATAMKLPKILILYINRASWNQTKAYVVPADPSATDSVKDLTRILRPVLDTKDPFKVIAKCAKKTASRAKWCGAKRHCFPE